MSNENDLKDFLGQTTLIVGEVNAGKTTYTRQILEAMSAEGMGPRIVIVDLAPLIPLEIAARRGLKGAGGRLVSGDAGVLVIYPRLRAPRLSSKTEEEAFAVAEDNLEACRRAFAEASTTDRDVLFVNDASLFVQAGAAGDLAALMNPFETVVANGYYGMKLGRGNMSRRERLQMEALMAHCDRVIEL